VQAHEDVVAPLDRFERVEALYDGLAGKLIPWTKQHGGTSDDPSAQVFVLGADGAVVARCPDATAHAAGALAGWVTEQANAYEQAHPRTRVPLVTVDVVWDGEGATRKAVCAAFDQAVAAGTPVLLYAGREKVVEGEKGTKAEVALARKFEKGPLQVEAAATASAGWALLRLDLARDADRAFLATLGVTAAPQLVLVPAKTAPGDVAKARVLVPKDVSGASLAALLQKHGPTAPR
jgi:hypothetical protein